MSVVFPRTPSARFGLPPGTWDGTNRTFERVFGAQNCEKRRARGKKKTLILTSSAVPGVSNRSDMITLDVPEPSSSPEAPVRRGVGGRPIVRRSSRVFPAATLRAAAPLSAGGAR